MIHLAGGRRGGEGGIERESRKRGHIYEVGRGMQCIF